MNVYGLVLSILLCLGGTAANEAFSYDDVPGVAMEYRVFVDGGKEDCYYQYVHPGSSLYVSFWVIRGGDGMAGFAVKDPKGVVVLPYEWKKESEYEEQSSDGGYYEICVDNQFSRFASKLVNLYVTTFRYDQWEKYTADVEAIDANVANFTNTLQSVNVRIQTMLKYQQLSRSTESRDMSLLLANKAYVQFWSVAQCFVIMAAGGFQVYFVRKLFDTNPNRGRI
ncbi:unnamed protein product [Notodromas monacha]|uniref:GOLD domain-containing protein n=1 Tax=Notodromas monacha TaxID=399045 RepID=A0A7R9BNU4_9CRUS|nr:unnamed protein product [Notodromas monacha]CAG0918076.1 unnamed protein product [Notodromas monacha]